MSKDYQIDDGLNGVDDFLDEGNPFDDINVENDDNINTNTAPINTNSFDNDPNIQLESNDIVENNERDYNQLSKGLLNYYSRFFNIDKKTFNERIIETLKLNGHIFKNFSSLNDNANVDENNNNTNNNGNIQELYGAVWITITVIIVKFLTPGFFEMILDNIILGKKNEKFIENRSVIYFKLLHSIWLFTIYTFATPVLLHQIIKRTSNGTTDSDNNNSNNNSIVNFDLNIKDNLINLITCYGYNNINWLLVLPILDFLNVITFKDEKVMLVSKTILLSIIDVKCIIFFINQFKSKDQHIPMLKKLLNLPILLMAILQSVFCLLILFILY